MAKNLGSKCKLCRRAGEKLFLKGERCESPKCAMIKKAYAPGAHGSAQRKTSLSEFGRQLAKKQKIKRIFGVSEEQLKKHLRDAKKKSGSAADNLLSQMEMRFDNVVYRAGLAQSRTQARQLVSHSQFLLNDKVLNIPSAILKVGDKIGVKKSKIDKAYFQNLKVVLKKGKRTPQWLAFDSEKMEGKVLSLPAKGELSVPGGAQEIVEFYSR